MKPAKLSFFHKYMLSYILVLTIPIIAFVMFANARFFTALREERIRNNENILYSMMHSSDTIITSLDNLHLQFLFDQRINPFTLGSDINSALSTISLLNTITQSNSFIFETAIYFINDDFIFTSQGSYSLRMFHEAGFNFSNWSKQDFLNDISHINTAKIRPAETVMRNMATELNLVTFIYPISHRAGAIDAVLIFLVEERFFINQPSNNGYNTPTVRFVIDSTGQVILYTLSYEIYNLGLSNFYLLLDEVLQKTNNIKFVANEFFLTTSTISSQTGWSYVTFTPLSDVMVITTRIRNEMLIVVMAILAIAAIAIYFGLRSNYRPFAKLSEFASHYHKHDKNLNEIEIVREAIQYLDRRNTEIIEHTFTAAEEYVLRRLILGYTQNKNDMEKVMTDFTIEFLHPSFVVAYMYGTGDMDVFAEKVKLSIKPPFAGYVLTEQTNRSLIIILNFDQQQFLDFFDEMQKLHNAITNTIGSTVKIGVGNIHDSISEISNSYIEARFAMDYLSNKRESNIIFAEELLDIEEEIAVSQKEVSDIKLTRLDYIKEYVDNNYTDPNFSLQNLADHVDMGVTNLSQYFKKKTGQNLVDYVTRLRMEHSKALLEKQKYKLDDIAHMTGYLNTSSFIRRFKQYYGITPGKYSKQ